MKHNLEQFCRGLETVQDSVRGRSSDFCSKLGITVFAYCRVQDDGRATWVTSNPEQDRFLLESQALGDDPVFDTKKALTEGQYLWFCDRHFPGSDAFYSERKKRYKMDHGMVLARHNKNYLETCCFSGLLEKRPLYNLFMNKPGLFTSFMDHFVKSLDRKLKSHLDEGISIGEVKKTWGKPKSELLDLDALASLCGDQSLSLLSAQEKRCLLLVKEGYSCPAIGKKLFLSHRTIEHYMESIKNKLGCKTRAELCQMAEKLATFSY